MTHLAESDGHIQASPNMPPSPQRAVDVIILGGGLAGLTLALQLKQRQPMLDLLVVEKNRHPVQEAAFKVGESTVEVAGFYLRNVLGLKTHLKDAQLVKQGFRFFHSGGTGLSLAERPELGSTFEDIFGTDPYPSYQLDRGRLENRLGEEVRQLGITFWDGCKVDEIALKQTTPADMQSVNQSAGTSHMVTVVRDEAVSTVQAKWLVDASGQVGLLRRQLKLDIPIAHDVNAVWFRVNQLIDPNEWSQNTAWQARVETPDLRIYCTTHLCGAGYWVWIIPLASGSTSIGIVADEALHPLHEINRLERALDWLRVHEPECAHAVETMEIQDFKVLRHFAHGCKQVFSEEGWYITGIAGAFTDPLFSPGSDLISVSNSMITDLIIRQYAGEDTTTRTASFNHWYLNFIYDMILQEYVDQYPTFGSAPVMAAKKVWNVTWYWGILAPLFCHGKLTDPEFLAAIDADLTHLHQLQSRVQNFLKAWYATAPQQYSNTYADYLLSYMYDLYNDIETTMEDAPLQQRIKETVNLLDSLAAKIFQLAPDVAPTNSTRSTEEPAFQAEFDIRFRSLLIDRDKIAA